ncbi:MAG TPA: hypothetical protein VHD55_02875 [Candidatus Paceibacterota bacterium]|nr:hypothetical protein [Candidatus Paceibacterota bacterium]
MHPIVIVLAIIAVIVLFAVLQAGSAGLTPVVFAAAWQEWRCRRAHAYLMRHDPDFRDREEKHARHQRNHAVAREREELYTEGVSPDDPRIPNFEYPGERDLKFL